MEQDTSGHSMQDTDVDETISSIAEEGMNKKDVNMDATETQPPTHDTASLTDSFCPAARKEKVTGHMKLSGPVYEAKFAGLVAARLRALRRTRPDLQFFLHTDLVSAQPFEDLIVTMSWQDNGEERNFTYFFQLKYKDNTRAPITVNDLTRRGTAGNKDFNLKNYYVRHRESVDRLTRVDSKELTYTEGYLRSCFLADFRLVLFTNKEMYYKETRGKSALDFPFEKEIFHTGQGETFSFGETDREVCGELKEVPSEFFQKLRICSAQADLSQMDLLLAHALEDALGTFHPRLDSLVLRYSDFLSGWWSKNSSDPLSGNSGEIDEIVMVDINSQLKILRFLPSHVDAVAQRHNSRANYIVVPGISPRMSGSLVKSVLERRSHSRFVIITPDILDDYTEDTLQHLCSQYYYDHIVMCVVSLNKRFWQVWLEKVISNRQCWITIISSEWDEDWFQVVGQLTEWNAWSECWTMAQLLEEDQKRLLKKKVLFQNQEVALSTLSETWPSMKQDVRGTTLGALAMNKHCVVEVVAGSRPELRLCEAQSSNYS